MTPESQIIHHGFAILNECIDTSRIQSLEKELSELKVFEFSSDASRVNLLKHSKAVHETANNPELNGIITNICDRKMFPVKAFVLDKALDNNWAIPWHQDLKIAVEQQVAAEGYTNWSVEAGITHVHPPVHVMERLITIRIHLDSASEKNGAIHVVPGSHKKGVIDNDDIQRIAKGSGCRLCTVDSGGIMIMKPLLLHDSPPSHSSARRRILQIEFGYELGNGVRWYDLS
ncbi:phytanoyl-CoA dioxygenase family protein [Daejeonella sp. JGW-45]|uniref:phytanoyl-CoA dioxygenase family protein n=1 Tax=Daejeonella sp. JGW-45 TaxID=3034148 RepID=UPI0023EDD75A|nr:phytanoyl-CoA dioxygenase family protein [Daejeonella sp. JGW-45]